MRAEPSGVVVILTTAPTVDKAAEIARTLVAEKLAACVNLVSGVRSIYAWKGEICDEGEVLCVVKTRSDRVDALRERLCALHPYEVPEVLVLDVVDGHLPYLSWVREVVG
jgi:periplasmic divalent cation tolerance protein